MSKTDGQLPKVVIVTGAAAGVGRAIAVRFAEAGCKLGLIARDRVALDAFAQELRNKGVEVAIAAIDVSDAAAMDDAATQFEQALGPVDLWVNDAMVTVFSLIDDITPDEFHRVTEVTYLGTVYGCMAALKRMKTRQEGHIINIGSALAYRGIPLQSAYCGSKSAIRGFTASLRSELEHAKSAITVSIIELPAVNTPQFDWGRTHMTHQPKPMGTIYQPEAAAEAVFRAARLHPREYWVGLSTVLTIVGNMILPDFMDWYLGRTAVKGQETGAPVQPDRKNNLFQPVTELHRVHGSFGAEAKPRAVILSGSLTRAVIVSAGAVLFFVLGALVFWLAAS